MRIIALAGRGGSGKTTVAGMLTGILAGQGKRVLVDGFGLPLKNRWREAAGLSEHEWLDKDEGCRLWMQKSGGNVRKVDPGYWVSYLSARNDLDLEGEGDGITPPDFLVVDDVRHPDEAEFCAERGVVWLVNGKHKPLAGQAAEHESERVSLLLKYVEAVILNERGLDRLMSAVLHMVKHGAHLKSDKQPAA